MAGRRSKVRPGQIVALNVAYQVAALWPEPYKAWDCNILFMAETATPVLVGEHNSNTARVEVDDCVNRDLRERCVKEVQELSRHQIRITFSLGIPVS